MTRHTTDLEALARPAAPTLANLTQATAIEQARAVAEVQAAVTVTRDGIDAESLFPEKPVTAAELLPTTEA